MQRSLNRLARFWTYEIQGLALWAWVGLILLGAVLIARMGITVDGIVGMALGGAFLAVSLSIWAVAIGAAVFSWKRTSNYLEGHSPKVVARSIAGVVAVVVCFSALLSLALLFRAFVLRVWE